MNMKKITDVPIIEELGENSYVLVNNNGAAAQISGSKVGGGGGESDELPMLYGLWGEDDVHMKVMEAGVLVDVDYETGKSILLQRPCFANAESPNRVTCFTSISFYDDTKDAEFGMLNGSSSSASIGFVLMIFSDSES